MSDDEREKQAHKKLFAPWKAIFIGVPIGLGGWALFIWAIWRLIRPQLLLDERTTR